MDWQRSAIEAAAAHLREAIAAGGDDYRTRSVYEGLLDVLDPVRHASRTERAASANVSARLTSSRGGERRSRMDRRGRADRRLVNFGPAADGERRGGQERRSAVDRRNH